MPMKRIKVSAKAKVNFALDIVGKDGGFHTLKTVVSTMNFSDEIILKKRKDDRISLKVIGSAGCSADENNAYKASKLFKKTFRVSGFDVILKKKIPVGSGLGGSSADASAVLVGLKKLFGVEADITPLANALGSDTLYMTRGGYALLEGRGEKITAIDTDLKLFLILCTAIEGVNTKDAYAKFDEIGETYDSVADVTAKAIKDGDYNGLIKSLKNDLYLSATKLNPEVAKNYETMSKFAPTVMSGSGATVFSVFKCKKDRDEAYKTLSKILKGKLIKTETV